MKNTIVNGKEYKVVSQTKEGYSIVIDNDFITPQYRIVVNGSFLMGYSENLKTMEEIIVV